MTLTFETLPVELIAEIFSELDLETLIKVSYLSRRIHAICSDSSLNPWRRPILRNLRAASYEPCLKHLSVRSTVPRQNWHEILSLATPSFILFDATLPNLKAADWEECFSRRFLPGWKKWKKDASWKEAYLKFVLRFIFPVSLPTPNLRMLHRVWHRSQTSCTADESWTKSALACLTLLCMRSNSMVQIHRVEPQRFGQRIRRLVPQLQSHGPLQRNEVTTFCSLSSPPYDSIKASKQSRSPGNADSRMSLLFRVPCSQYKSQLVTTIADVRILAFGTLHRPRSTLMVNPNAHMFLHPPGIDMEESDIKRRISRIDHLVTDHGVYPMNGGGPLVGRLFVHLFYFGLILVPQKSFTMLRIMISTNRCYIPCQPPRMPTTLGIHLGVATSAGWDPGKTKRKGFVGSAV